MVREIQSKQEFDEVLSNSGDKLVVIDYTASWCGPCRNVAPKFEELSQKYTDNCVFIKVDVDNCKAVAKAQKISAMPTFQFYKKQTKYFGFLGADVNKLESSIQTYSAADAQPSEKLEDEGGAGCLIL